MNNNDENLKSLWEMEDCLLILQNAHAAVTVIINKIVSSSSSLDSEMVKVLLEEVSLMTSEIDRMHISIRQLRMLINKTS